MTSVLSKRHNLLAADIQANMVGLHMPNILSKKRNLLAMEMIEHQTDNFGKDIEGIVIEIFDALKNFNKELFTKLINKLEKTIFTRTGLKTKIITNSDLFATMPLYLNENHVFLADFFRGSIGEIIPEQNKFIKEAINKKGFVNLAKAKVGGMFSDYSHNLYINFELAQKYNFTPPESTAAILHEIGHLFTACEYSDRIDTTNQILADISKHITDKNNTTYVFKELKSISPDLKEDDIKALMGDDKVIAGRAFFIVAFGIVKHQLEYQKYDETSFEQLSDSFSARFGYGRESLLCLERISTISGSYEKHKSESFATSIIQIIRTIILLSLIVTFLSISIPLVMIFSSILFLNIWLSGDNYSDLTYDELKIRYKRIRMTYIDKLKKLDLDKKVISKLLTDIKFMDDIIADTYIFNPINRVISNFLFSSSRNAKNSISNQQLMEDLAFNDLFIKSAELKIV